MTSRLGGTPHAHGPGRRDVQPHAALLIPGRGQHLRLQRTPDRPAEDEHARERSEHPSVTRSATRRLAWSVALAAGSIVAASHHGADLRAVRPSWRRPRQAPARPPGGRCAGACRRGEGAPRLRHRRGDRRAHRRRPHAQPQQPGHQELHLPHHRRQVRDRTPRTRPRRCRPRSAPAPSRSSAPSRRRSSCRSRRGPPAGPCPESRYAMAGGCYALQVAADRQVGRPLRRRLPGRGRPATPAGAPAALPGHRPRPLPALRRPARLRLPAQGRCSAAPTRSSRRPTRAPTPTGPSTRAATATCSASAASTSRSAPTAAPSCSRRPQGAVPACTPTQRLRALGRGRRRRQRARPSAVSRRSRRSAASSTRTPTAWPSSSSAATSTAASPGASTASPMRSRTARTTTSRAGAARRWRTCSTAARRAPVTTRSAGRPSRTGRHRTR